jgi:hypothetical protein
MLYLKGDSMSLDIFKRKFEILLSSGLVHGRLSGPKNNVLVCDSMNDWAIAAGEFARDGFVCSSPGHFGPHPQSRQNTHKKIWKTGTLCAIVIEKKVIFFSLPQTEKDYCLIPE